MSTLSRCTLALALAALVSCSSGVKKITYQPTNEDLLEVNIQLGRMSRPAISSSGPCTLPYHVIIGNPTDDIVRIENIRVSSLSIGSSPGMTPASKVIEPGQREDFAVWVNTRCERGSPGDSQLDVAVSFRVGEQPYLKSWILSVQ